jgi:ribonucleotide reductase beta subunit family protein with ferritin-like domain
MIFKNLFKYTPTLQEQQFIDIAKELLNHPDTVVRMTFCSRKYFLTNEKKHYYMMLQYPNVQVTNTKFSFAKSIHPKAYDMLLEIVHDYIEKDRQTLEDQIFENENKMLEQVRTKLQLTV